MTKGLVVLDPGHGGAPESFYDLDNGVRLPYTWEQVLGLCSRARHRLVDGIAGRGGAELDGEPRFYFQQNGRKVTYGDPGFVIPAHPEMPEKDIVLDVCRTVRGELGDDLVIKTTRDRDGYVAAGSRLLRARRAYEIQPGPAAFVSLHADGGDDRRTHGFTVHRPPGRRSRPLAEELHRALVTHLEELGHRGFVAEIQERELPLLRQLEMPAVRVQLGYLTHPLDVDRLLDRHCREALGTALARAIRRSLVRHAGRPAAVKAEAPPLGRGLELSLIEAHG